PSSAADHRGLVDRQQGARADGERAAGCLPRQSHGALAARGPRPRPDLGQVCTRSAPGVRSQSGTGPSRHRRRWRRWRAPAGRGPGSGSPASPPVPRSPTIWPLPVLPVPELAPLMVILPVLPSTVPVKLPLSWAVNVPSGWKVWMLVATRVPLSTPVRVWTSVAVTIVLPSACRMLMTSPVVVKLPLPDDSVEAWAAGSRSRDASRGSAANTALNTFIVDSFPTVMNSARAGLTAKQPGAVRTRRPDGM